ncbi:MAG TPA: glycine cleavage system aminomethyltransferase GcvT [bacterium]|nr:glycine cleavage system aminomethyltransferase GcvT [bacterium]
MKETPLYARHAALGATIVDFGGWAMPVQYTNVIEEHRTTREKAGLFDICHMGEFTVKGSQVFDFLQWVLSRNIADQEVGQVKLSVLTNEQGGIVDDLTVYKFADDHYMLVTNAGTKDKDLAWLQKAQADKGFDVTIEDISDATGKLDFQGPAAESVLQQITRDDLKPVKFYGFIETEVLGMPAIVSRSGYTGEDGFEIYADSTRIGEIWDEILRLGTAAGVAPIGLGARDTLRLECGMNLYGHEINDEITPLEGRYGWVTDLGKDFIGVEVLRKQKEAGVPRKLVGFEMVGRGIAREHYPISKDGQPIGMVSSGTFAPTVNKAIGMAHLKPEYCAEGTEIDIEIRGKHVAAKVVKLPFYKRS